MTVTDRDTSVINHYTVQRLHELLDRCGAPTIDDHGETLNLRWRLVALATELESARQ